MEGQKLSFFVEYRTHGMTVPKHINWDDPNWVAITPTGSLVAFRDRTDGSLYVLYVENKGQYHVHFPLVGYWREKENVFCRPGDYCHETPTYLIKDGEEEKVKAVLEEIWLCLQTGECYVDTTVSPYIYFDLKAECLVVQSITK